jgi:hypothetical protein
MTVDWDWGAGLVALGLFDVLGMAEISFKRTIEHRVFGRGYLPRPFHCQCAPNPSSNSAS